MEYTEKLTKHQDNPVLQRVEDFTKVNNLKEALSPFSHSGFHVAIICTDGHISEEEYDQVFSEGGWEKAAPCGKEDLMYKKRGADFWAFVCNAETIIDAIQLAFSCLNKAGWKTEWQEQYVARYKDLPKNELKIEEIWSKPFARLLSGGLPAENSDKCVISVVKIPKNYYEEFTNNDLSFPSFIEIVLLAESPLSKVVQTDNAAKTELEKIKDELKKKHEQLKEIQEKKAALEEEKGSDKACIKELQERSNRQEKERKKLMGTLCRVISKLYSTPFELVADMPINDYIILDQLEEWIMMSIDVSKESKLHYHGDDAVNLNPGPQVLKQYHDSWDNNVIHDHEEPENDHEHDNTREKTCTPGIENKANEYPNDKTILPENPERDSDGRLLY